MKSKILRILGVVATVAMIASALVAPVTAVSTPVLAVGSTQISTATTYTVTFTLGVNQPASATAIKVTFPTGAVITAATATIATNSGLGSDAIPAQPVVITIAGQVATVDTLVAEGAFPQSIGAGALVQLVFSGVVNPAAIGDYNVKVATSAEATAVASNNITTTAPVPPALPGITKVYNSAGILMTQFSGVGAIASAIGAVAGTGWKIEMYPGTFVETPLVIPVADTTLTVIGVGAVGDIIVAGSWTINATGVTFKNFTSKPAAGTTAITVAATASGVVIDGLAMTKNSTAAGETMISYGNTVAATTGTIKNCAFTLGAGSTFDIAIDVLTGAIGLTVSTNTFALDINETTYVNDIGVNVAATCTVDSNQFTTVVWGGTGVNATNGTATVTNNKFTGGLMSALTVNGATANVVFKLNTVAVLSLTEALWPVATFAAQPITVYANGTVSITENSFASAANQTMVIWPGADASTITVMFNSIATSNKLGIANMDTATLNATHNYWGAATGPAAGYNAGTYGTGVVDSSSYLGGVLANSKFAAATGLVNAGAGVDIVGATAATVVGSGSYAANPIAIAIPAKDASGLYTIKAVSYFDAFAVNATAGSLIVYGTTANPVTALTQVYFFNAVWGRWDPAGAQIPNVYGNYITVTLGGAPTMAAFAGLPFAVVTLTLIPTVPAAVPAVVPPYAPIVGTVNFPIDGTFTWAPVAGATSYEVVVAEDSALADKFAVINYSSSTPINASKIPADQVLKYNTLYWWRVRAVNAVGPGAWTVGSLTTAKAPEVVVTPTTTVITTTIPVVTSVPAPIVTLSVPTQEPVNVIPPFLLWSVVAVGVILIIAVIVLIVRTRRIS